jgi:hypothetical protein
MAFPIDQWNIKDLTHKEIDILADGKEISKVFCWFAEIEIICENSYQFVEKRTF